MFVKKKYLQISLANITCADFCMNKSNEGHTKLKKNIWKINWGLFLICLELSERWNLLHYEQAVGRYDKVVCPASCPISVIAPCFFKSNAHSTSIWKGHHSWLIKHRNKHDIVCLPSFPVHNQVILIGLLLRSLDSTMPNVYMYWFVIKHLKYEFISWVSPSKGSSFHFLAKRREIKRALCYLISDDDKWTAQ